MSKLPVKPLTHCAMHELRFPTRQTCPTTLPTTPIHSKTVCPSKDSNPYVKVTSQAPNPLRHAPFPLPGIPHNPNHFPHHPNTQQKTPDPSGIDPASEKHTQNHLTDCARPGKHLCENFIDTFFVPAEKLFIASSGWRSPLPPEVKPPLTMSLG